MKTSQLLDMGSKILKKRKIPSSLIESEIILSRVLKTSREKRRLVWRRKVGIRTASTTCKEKSL